MTTINTLASTTSTIINPKDLAKATIPTLVSAILFLNEQVKGSFFTDPTGAAPADDAQKRAERMFNDPTSGVYADNKFSALVQMQNDFTPRFFGNVGRMDFKVGMVVTPRKPEYRDRVDDGYEMGKHYLVTNQTYGHARSSDNLNASVKGSTKPMSQNNDEWTLVTDVDAITALVTALVDGLGVKFVEDVAIDKGSGKSLEGIINQYLVK